MRWAGKSGFQQIQSTGSQSEHLPGLHRASLSWVFLMTREAAFYLLKTDHLDLSFLNPSRSDERSDVAVAVERLASALGASPAWKTMPAARLVLRRDPVPRLAVVGYFDRAEKTRLEGLQWQLDHVLPRLRFVSYREAEKDCEDLAEQLRSRFPRSELASFYFEAIPRGGGIVLGMLAYLLDLTPFQFETGRPTHTAPRVLVDDCAISGTRMSQFLRSRDDSQLIFAHLYSHPELRARIEQEPRVLACVSAQDLVDHAPGIYGEQYRAWRTRWEHRSTSAYWIGQPDYVCFAWSEPDFLLWNPVTGQTEAAWRMVPPELCLKNRGASDSHTDIQIQPEGKGRLRPSARVLFAQLESDVIVADLEGGETFELSGSAGDMWNAIVETGTLAAAAEQVAGAYQADTNIVETDLEVFVTDLRARGLLQEGGG